MSQSSFSIVMGITQLVILILFLTIVKTNVSKGYEHDEYIIFRDIMVMLLLGFGYLMTFLKKYGLGAVGFTMMLTILAMELNLIVEPMIESIYNGENFDKSISIDMASLIDSEFAAATLLISYGAILGRATPLQLLIMAIFQSIFYAINKVVFVFGILGAEDVGGTMTIHMFGAYFGLAASRAFSAPKISSSHNASPNAVSDLISLIGTTLLWVYWPSFVGATETGVATNEKYCLIHTVLALIGSTGVTFFMSHKLRHGQFDPVHIANSTLAGGVAVGSSARLDMTPGGALLLGMIVGAVSVYGYVNITPLIEEKLGIYDTCGVHNLHGMPSVIGGLASAIFVYINSDAPFLLHAPASQVICQLAGVAVTILLAIASGSFTGAIMVMSVMQDSMPAEYDDAAWWEGEYFEYTTAYHNNNGDKNSYDSTKHLPDEGTPLV